MSVQIRTAWSRILARIGTHRPSGTAIVRRMHVLDTVVATSRRATYLFAPPIHATQPHRPTCWDPPTQQQDYGYAGFDHRPRRVETCWDRPHHQEEVRAPRSQSAYHQPRHNADQPPRLGLPPRDLYGQPTRVTNQPPYQPPHSPTCWDPSGLHTQQGYQVDDTSFEIFGSDDLCWGRRSSLSHNRYIECSIPSPVKTKKTTPGRRSLGSRCEPDYQVSVGIREQEGDETSDSSILDEQIANSCVEARVFDCVGDRGMGKEELGDFEDSILASTAKKTGDRDADSSDIGSVSNVAIRLPSYSSEMSKEDEEDELLDNDEGDDSTDEGKMVIDLSNVVRVPSKNDVGNSWGKNEGALSRKLSKDSVLVDERKCTFDSVLDDKSGDLLDPTQWEFEIKDEVRKRSVFARIQRPCTFTFDPGGDNSPKLLLSTLRCYVVSTLRTRWILTVGELLRSYLL